MKKAKIVFAITLGALLFASLSASSTVAKPTADTFEVVIPWGLDHPRGKIIKSMIDNSSIAGDYDFEYTVVGGGPSDRVQLFSRFAAKNYPDLLLVTQDWYTEFADFGIFHNFADEVADWADDRAGWVDDIPDGWWSILDLEKGDGTGDKVFALPFFGQSILPYINTDNFTAAGLTAADVDTLDGWLDACETLDGEGITPFAMVGKSQSDLAYMNYMFGSTDNFIDSRSDPATVFPWDDDGMYGVNGTLNVEGFAAYLKMKGEGWVPDTVETDGGGEANTVFGNGEAAMVLCGPWGTSIFEGAGLENFKAIPMPKSSDGVRSTITGGGISLVPSDAANAADAAVLAQELLEDEHQMKTVDNWLNQAWRIPVRTSLKDKPWFSAHDNRSNFVTHIESQSYAYPWGKQHPKWLSVHSDVMIPGYLAALNGITWNAGYTDAQYTAKAQEALDSMAAAIQVYYLKVDEPTAAPGFTIASVLLLVGLLGSVRFIRRRK